MTDEYNQLRRLAHEIIIKLYDAKAESHLTLLKQHIEKAIKELHEDKKDDR